MHSKSMKIKSRTVRGASKIRFRAFRTVAGAELGVRTAKSVRPRYDLSVSLGATCMIFGVILGAQMILKAFQANTRIEYRKRSVPGVIENHAK